MKTKQIIIALLLCAALAPAVWAKDKVYLIGIDGAEWRAIDFLITRGELPNIKRLKQDGSWGFLTTDVGCSPISWTSIATGKNMDKHGVNSDDFFKREFESSVIKTKRIWDIIEENGKQAGVYKWFFTNPARKINGFWVTKYDRDPSYLPGFQKDDGNKGDLLLRLLDKYNCDFIAAFWHTVDPFQHFFWLYHELNENPDSKKYPRPVMNDMRKYSERIYSSYREFDGKLGELLKCLEKDDSLIVVSDHGFRLSNELSKGVRVNHKILDVLGISAGWTDENDSVSEGEYEGVKFKLEVDYSSSYSSDIFPYTELKYREKVSSPLLRVVFDQNADKYKVKTASRDMSGVFENLKQNGGDIFALKEARENELVFELSRHARKVIGDIREPMDTEFLEIDARTGDHWSATPGVVILYGSKFKRGFQFQGAHLYDIAPTVLCLMDMPIGKDMDGKVLQKAFSKPEEHKLLYIKSYDDESSKPVILDSLQYQADRCLGTGKVFLIGLDGGDWGVIDYMIGERELPYIKKIKENGSYGYLATDTGISPVSWTSIATGKQAHKHGIDSAGPLAKSIGQSSIRARRIWDIVQASGVKTGVFKWFLTNPAGKINGFWVPQYDTDPPYLPGLEIASKDNFDCLIDSYGCGFTAAMLTRVEPEQDFYWLYHLLNLNPGKDKYPEEIRREIDGYSDKIYAGYREFDAKLGEVFKRLDDGDCLIIVSDHGEHKAPVLTKEIKVNSRFPDKMGIRNGWGDDGQTRAEGEFGGVKFEVSVDYSRFYPMNIFSSALPEYKMQITDPELRLIFDNNSVKDKKAAEEGITAVIQGVRQDNVDVFSLQDKGNEGITFKLSAAARSQCEKIKGAADTGFLSVNVHTGDHSAESPGILIFYGKPFKKNFQIKEASLYDITPTALYLMGLPIGRDMDGKVLLDVFERPCDSVGYIDSYDSKALVSVNEMSHPLDARQKRNLRSLGYIQ